MCACGANKPITVQQMTTTAGGTLPYLEFAYCAYKSQFMNVFNQVGISVDTRDKLPLLAQVLETGGDLGGAVKDAKGNPIYFSVEKQLKLIDTTKPENLSCSVR